MDTQQVVARFEAERQALAMMDHPDIAKVLDAGTTDSGRPYFVMELVKGVRITRYCDDNNLTTRQRLGLFTSVCQAVQHAHQKGIIHRDIKPSNIMITLHDGVPVPKVIDFGIAKATQQELTEKTIHTQYGQMIGTPTYMSPEQAEMSGLDVDRRSDIYSLGVLLHEVLTGTTPLERSDLLSGGYDEIRRRTKEEAPQNRRRGSGTNRTIAIVPVANLSGATTTTLSVTDGDLTATDTFVLTVNSSNDPPTISDISDQTVDEDQPTAGIGFTVGDVETPAETPTVTATSDNPALIADTSITLEGSGADRTATVLPTRISTVLHSR